MRGLLTVLLIASLIFLSGCASLQKTPLQRSNEPVYGKGLIIEKIDLSGTRVSAGQKGFVEGQNFRVNVYLKNYDREPIMGEMRISDSLSDTYGGISEDTQEFILEGAEIIRKDKGEVERIPSEYKIVFGPYIYDNLYSGNEESFTTTNIVLDAKYNYETFAAGQVCVSDENSEGCAMEENLGRLGGNTEYAPITVAGVRKSLIYDDPNTVIVNLDIDIKNVGGGRINNLRQEIERMEVTLDRRKMQCYFDFDQETFEYADKKTLFCDLTMGVNGFYDSILEIRFGYPYFISKTLSEIPILGQRVR